MLVKKLFCDIIITAKNRYCRLSQGKSKKTKYLLYAYGGEEISRVKKNCPLFSIALTIPIKARNSSTYPIFIHLS